MSIDRKLEVTVKADPNADDCLAAAAENYLAQHRNLRGWDLAPRWTDETRETVTLTVPRWHYDALQQSADGEAPGFPL